MPSAWAAQVQGSLDQFACLPGPCCKEKGLDGGDVDLGSVPAHADAVAPGDVNEDGAQAVKPDSGEADAGFFGQLPADAEDDGHNVGLQEAADFQEVTDLEEVKEGAKGLANESGNYRVEDDAAALASTHEMQRQISPSRAESRDSIEKPLALASLLKLTALLGSPPDFFFVDSWFWTMRGGGKLLATTLVLNWVISAVLTGAGLALAWLYHEAFDWEGNFDNCIVFGVIGGIFTGWNIAQYASYAIQTTGHLTIWQHMQAIVRIGPVLLPCNLSGWLLGYVVVATSIVGWPMPVKIVIIAAPPIASGIAAKTMCKLRYVRSLAALGDDPKRTDALTVRLRQEAKFDNGQMPACPFKAITCKVFAAHSLGPYTCFLWTCAYVVALRLGFVLADRLDPVWRAVLQTALFVVSLLAQAGGMYLLNKWVQGSRGIFGYNHQMYVAFVVIYCMVSDVQVRLGIIKMDTVVRLICSFIQPTYFSFMRYTMVMAWKKDNATTLMDRLMREPWIICACMGSVVMQNISAALLAGLSCLYQDIDVFTLGVCTHGFVKQIVLDSGFTWLSDVVTMAAWIKLGMPVLYFFSLLDAFLVVAALLVTYLCTILALLTASISL